jgi:glycerate kinase
VEALNLGVRRIIVGIGESATNDGGAWMLQALGARLLDSRGREIGAGGSELLDLDRIDLSGPDQRLQAVEIPVAPDDTNPLTGAQGAASVYGPQKGAVPDDVAVLNRGLKRLADVASRTLGVDLRDHPGAGGGPVD